MAQHYLLPCPSCGAKNPVETRQAGETVPCACGKPLSVPTLRGLRQLEPAANEAPPPEAAPKRGWSPIHGFMFSLGLIVAIGAGAMAARHFLIYSALQQQTADRTSEIDAMSNEYIDNMSLSESITAWNQLNFSQLGEDGPPPWMLARQQATAYFFTASIWLGVASLGALAFVLSLLIRPAATRFER
jgi:hypothetical protein